MIRRLFIILFATLSCSIASPQDFDVKRIKSVCDSVLLNAVGECIFNKLISFKEIGIDTSVIHYNVVDKSDPLLQDTVAYSLYGKYLISLYGKELDDVIVRLNDDYTAYGFSGVGKVNDSTRGSSNCTIIAESEYKKILKKDKRRNVTHVNFRIRDVGLIAVYTFEPKKIRRKSMPMSFGVVEVNMHTGEKIVDRVIHGRF